jgi:glycosyltransferase involved in cell wall biosynthesis
MPVIDIHSVGFWVETCFVLVALYQIGVYLFLYGKLAFYKTDKAPSNAEKPPVSIIICAKNEADNLTEFLPKFLTQEYPAFEVIVVNDCSIDNTDDVLREYVKIFPNLRSINIQEDEYYKHGKKFAIMVGIKGAKYEHLLFTDGDCYPQSEHWISEMMRGYTAGKEVVIGYGPYRAEKSFLNKLIRFDTFAIALQYLSLGLSNKAYMGVGRNLSYKKDLFFKNKGFSTHYHITSGDDDLFINQNANTTNTSVIITKDSLTYSLPAKSFNEWNQQKSRHLSTSNLYTGASKNRLGMLHAGNYLFCMLFVASLFQLDLILVTAAVFIVKSSIQALVYHKAAKKLEEKDLLAGFLLFEFLLLFLYPMWHWQKRFIKTRKWKN